MGAHSKATCEAAGAGRAGNGEDWCERFEGDETEGEEKGVTTGREEGRVRRGEMGRRGSRRGEGSEEYERKEMEETERMIKERSERRELGEKTNKEKGLVLVAVIALNFVTTPP